MNEVTAEHEIRNDHQEPSATVHRRWLVMIIGLGLSLRLLAWGTAISTGWYDHLIKDAAGYVALGKGFGTAYLQSGGPLSDLALLRAPGYPAFLGLALLPGWGVPGAMLVQLIVSLAIIPLTYSLGKALGAGEIGALVGAALIAVEPMGIGLAVNPVSEAPATVLITAGLLVWVRSSKPLRWKGLLVAGIVFSLATLFRPTTLYLAPLALVGGILITSGRVKPRVLSASVLAAGMLLLPGLWIARNAVVTGVPILSTIEGTNMLEYRGAAIIARRDRVSFDEGRRRVVADFERTNEAADDAAHRSRQETAYGVTLVRRYPTIFAHTAAKGAQRFVLGPGYPYLLEPLGRDAFNPTGRFDQAVVIYSWVYLATAYVLAGLGAVRLIRARQVWLWVPPALLLGYMLVITAGGDTVSRFRAPLMPTIVAFGAVGVTMLINSRRATCP